MTIGLLISAIALASGDVPFGLGLGALTCVGLLELMEDRFPDLMTAIRKKAAMWVVLAVMALATVLLLLN